MSSWGVTTLRSNAISAAAWLYMLPFSLVLSDPSPAPSAVVLESMFPTITEAVSDRVRLYLGPLAKPLALLLLWQLPLRLGVSPEQLRPIAQRRHCVRRYSSLLVRSIGTRLSETKRLYDAAGRPKELWIVEGAAHVDLHAFDPSAYEWKISVFLAKYLRPMG